MGLILASSRAAFPRDSFSSLARRSSLIEGSSLVVLLLGGWVGGWRVWWVWWGVGGRGGGSPPRFFL